jgi:hypothetical protein
MRLSNRICSLTTAIIFGLSCGAVHADAPHTDGLTDLRTALTRLHGQTPLKALLEINSWRRQGEGKELIEDHGQAKVSFEDGDRGLQVLFSKDMLSRMDSEEREKLKNPNAKTPTLFGLREIESAELPPMISATEALSRMMDEAVFKSEKEDSYNGKPARLLRFQFGIEKLSERDRKYVKQFENNFDIWIDANGIPLASRMHQNASGRAFIVVGFESTNDEECVYGHFGDRLVTVRKESKSSSTGAGERGEIKVVKALQIQS